MPLTDVTQIKGIVISFISLAMSSAKLYYTQRLGKFSDANPSMKMQLFILPAIMVQLLLPLFSLVYMAANIRELVFVFICLVTLTNYLILRLPCLKDHLFPTLYAFYGLEEFQVGKDEENEVFATAVFTSWISPCTVWANQWLCRSYFLVVQSFTTMICHALGIIGTLCYEAYTDWSKHLQPPITHCFRSTDNFSLR